MRWQTLLFKDRFFTYTQDYGEKATDQATGTVTIEGSVYSMDSPAVRAKVMGTLRSAFFSGHCKDEDVWIYWNCISYAQDDQYIYNA
jgi:hypothetical protein